MLYVFRGGAAQLPRCLRASHPNHETMRLLAIKCTNVGTERIVELLSSEAIQKPHMVHHHHLTEMLEFLCVKLFNTTTGFVLRVALRQWLQYSLTVPTQQRSQLTDEQLRIVNCNFGKNAIIPVMFP